MDKVNEINSKDEKKSRHRGENWTQEEKDLLFEIMRKSAPIIENKQTDTNTNKQKNLEWVKVQNRLRELTGKYRDIAQIKGFWRRIKITAKKNVSQHKRAIKLTGGGHRPPSPTEDDQKVAQLCPTDFVIELNQFDSDGMFDNEKSNEPAIETNENNTIYDIELNESFLNESDVVNEIVTITENNGEVHIDQQHDIEKIIMKETSPKLKHKSKQLPRIKRKNENSQKGMIVASNIKFKTRSIEMMEEEHALKIKYRKLELSHQELRQKLEIDNLLLEKEKKQLEIKILKKSLE